MDIIKKFLDKKNIFAVIGVSRDKTKYGRKVYEELKEKGYKVYPINPQVNFTSEERCYSHLKDLPTKPDVVVFVIPPSIVEKIIIECQEIGIKKVWLQPGSESTFVIKYCYKNNIACLYNQCIIIKTIK